MKERITYKIDSLIERLNLLKSKGFEDCCITYIPAEDSLQIMGVDEDSSVNTIYTITTKYQED